MRASGSSTSTRRVTYHRPIRLGW